LANMFVTRCRLESSSMWDETNTNFCKYYFSSTDLDLGSWKFSLNNIDFI